MNMIKEYKVGEIIHINRDRFKGTITEIIKIENRYICEITFNNIVRCQNIIIKYPNCKYNNTSYYCITSFQVRLATEREEFLYHLYGPYKEGEYEI